MEVWGHDDPEDRLLNQLVWAQMLAVDLRLVAEPLCASVGSLTPVEDTASLIACLGRVDKAMPARCLLASAPHAYRSML